MNPAFYDELDMDEDEDDMEINEEAPLKKQAYGKQIPGFETDPEKMLLESSKWGGDTL